MALFSIEACFRIRSECIEGGVIVPRNATRQVGDRVFFHVSTTRHYCLALFTETRTKQRGRELSKTDFVDRLTNLRNTHIENARIRSKPPAVETLSFLVAKQAARKRGISRGYDVPDVLDIEFDGRMLSVLGCTKKCSPLYLELTPESIAFVRAYVIDQITEGSYKRSVKQKKVEEESANTYNSNTSDITDNHAKGTEDASETEDIEGAEEEEEVDHDIGLDFDRDLDRNLDRDLDASADGAVEAVVDDIPKGPLLHTPHKKSCSDLRSYFKRK